MKTTNSYLVSAPGWPMKYIHAHSATEAKAIWRKATGGPANPAVSQVNGRKRKTGGGE